MDNFDYKKFLKENTFFDDNIDDSPTYSQYYVAVTPNKTIEGSDMTKFIEDMEKNGFPFKDWIRPDDIGVKDWEIGLPKFKGIIGPMNDQGNFRYETQSVYNSYSLEEANPDGTISDDEEDREASLMANVEAEIDDLLTKAYQEAEEIGGQFRSPGIKQRIRVLIKNKILQAARNSIK